MAATLHDQEIPEANAAVMEAGSGIPHGGVRCATDGNTFTIASPRDYCGKLCLVEKMQVTVRKKDLSLS